MMLNQSNKLGITTLVIMSITAVFTLRTLPLMAEYGLSSIFYYALVAILFFIPNALTCAELATGWPKTGGLYIWIREAFGPKCGFVSIWLEWMNNVISFPATLTFITATMAYAIAPHFASNKFYLFTTMLILFWSSTIINFFGIKFSSMISNIAFLIGTLIPSITIITLAIIWLFTHHNSQLHITMGSFFPHMHLTHATFLASLLLGFGGMQAAGFHAQEMENPQKHYPRAVFIAIITVLALYILGSLAIGIVVPTHTLNIVTGFIYALNVFFNSFHLNWIMPIVAFLIAIGTLASLNIWIISPCKGLLAAAQHGDLPKIFKRTNRYNAPITLLFLQGCVSTLFASLYLFTPSISVSYWMLLALTTILVVPVYILLFAAVIRLRYTQPHVYRSYRIPGGTLGVWIMAGIGILVCTITLCVGFIPPEQLKIIHIRFYENFLIIGFITMISLPLIFSFVKNRFAETNT